MTAEPVPTTPDDAAWGRELLELLAIAPSPAAFQTGVEAVVYHAGLGQPWANEALARMKAAAPDPLTPARRAPRRAPARGHVRVGAPPGFTAPDRRTPALFN